MHRWILSATLLATGAAMAQTAPMTPDISGRKFEAPVSQRDFERREVMVPMRDGVKLFTVIMIPKGAHDAPMLLTRTPYNAARRTMRTEGATRLVDALAQGDTVFAEDGYIRVIQDVRGKYGSEGDYVMTRPPRGPLNSTPVDHVTDAWDTIDWLVKNVKESNGRVGMLGSSYEGFTVVNALLDPHPALKVAAPESPMIDGWMGDDWFQHGAYRQTNNSYIIGQTTARGPGSSMQMPGAATDDYAAYLRAGSAGDFGRIIGLDGLSFWQKITQHPSYDAFWQEQALDRLLAKLPKISVPTMWEQGLWDQEDMYGANHSWVALESKDADNRMNFLVIGPWRHSGANYNGSTLGDLSFNGDTALQWRRDVLKPFFDQYLKSGAPIANTPPVWIYDSGLNRWDSYQRWPQSCATNCPAKSRLLYLNGDRHLSFANSGGGKFAEYISDPANPVPFVPRPLSMADRSTWTTWLVKDQRFVDGRPDVLSYTSAPQTTAMKLAGMPAVNLDASTSGTDSDWVVKLIDVYPDPYPDDPKMAGYELPIALTIFRGRYRESFSDPRPLKADVAQHYRFELPNVNHTLLPGHHLMVQVQSTLFPLYDRNPQTFVPNIFNARAGDYRKATQRVMASSSIDLPVVSGELR